ncbi:MAG TPA: lysophospholipid acyltransferase family protein [Pyrinomonadaceae bacterium]|jgi:1-acyl-sn-glycerol-3-phosphate acyltransferase
MLEAKKSALFEKLFAVYNRNLLRRKFYSIEVSGLEFLLNKNPKLPLIIYCNHSSWWDGLVAFEISRKAGLRSYIMMEEKQLKKLFLFRLLGAFSVVREKPREALKSIDYAVDLLKADQQNTLWIFPQGKIVPNDRRPLSIYRGLARIVERVGECSTASLSMRYEFLGEFKPRIFVRIDEPQPIRVDENFDSKNLSKTFCARLTAGLDDLRNDVADGRFFDYEPIF